MTDNPTNIPGISGAMVVRAGLRKIDAAEAEALVGYAATMDHPPIRVTAMAWVVAEPSDIECSIGASGACGRWAISTAICTTGLVFQI